MRPVPVSGSASDRYCVRAPPFLLVGKTTLAIAARKKQMIRATDADTLLARYEASHLVAAHGRHCLGVRAVVGRRDLVVRELFGRRDVVHHELDMVATLSSQLEGVGARIEAMGVRNEPNNTARGWIVCERLRPLERCEMSGASLRRLFLNVQRMHEAGIRHANLHRRNVMQRASDGALLIIDPGNGVLVRRGVDNMDLARRAAGNDWQRLCSDFHRFVPIPRAIAAACEKAGTIDAATSLRWQAGPVPPGKPFDTNEVYFGVSQK